MYYVKSSAGPDYPVHFEVFNLKREAIKHAREVVLGGSSFADVMAVGVVIKNSHGGIDVSGPWTPIIGYRRQAGTGKAIKTQIE